MPGPDVDILRRVDVLWDTVADHAAFPFSLPAVRALDGLRFSAPVTFLVGENGSGKSTVVEALAMAAGLSPGGGNRDIRVEARDSESSLDGHLRLTYGTRPARSFLVRGETWFQAAHAYPGLMWIDGNIDERVQRRPDRTLLVYQVVKGGRTHHPVQPVGQQELRAGAAEREPSGLAPRSHAGRPLRCAA